MQLIFSERAKFWIRQHLFIGGNKPVCAGHVKYSVKPFEGAHLH